MFDVAASVAGDAPTSFDLRLDAVKDKAYLTHDLHPYPAKFIPQIPRRLIELHSAQGDVVLDPFCGSGTALVEARLLARSAVGVDLNPLSTLLSRVKATPLRGRELRDLADLERAAMDALSNGIAEAVTRPLPDFKNRDHWFEADPLRALNEILSLVEAVPSEPAREAARVAFSAIVVKASNQDSETRWVARPKGWSRDQVYRFFLEKLSAARGRLAEFANVVSPNGATDVHTCDARTLEALPDEVIDYAVTSPPYMNSFDYYLYHKLRLFWLGFDHKPVQQNEIGSRHRHCDLGIGEDQFYSEMALCLGSVRRVLKNGAKLTLVFGDSIIRGELIAMDEIYEQLARDAGLRPVDRFDFDQRRYTRSFHRGFKTAAKRSYVITYEAF